MKVIRLVFRMCLTWKNKEEGFVFPNETYAENVSSAYTIPWVPGESRSDITKFEYQMPGMFNDEVINYSLSFREGIFIVTHQKLPQPIGFSLSYPYDATRREGQPDIRPLPYLGTKLLVVTPFNYFVPIYPLDIDLMDKACLEGLVLVGQTDVFPDP